MASNEDKLLFELLGKRIKELRTKAGYSSQETFAYDAEIPRSLYGRYEKGSNITVSSLYRILKAHKLSFDDFFSEGFDELKQE
ncbi:helix-turn-helix domain-containing protein [Pedobacter sp.]